MTSLMTTSLILFSCWVMIVKCRAAACPDDFLDFFSVFNGNYETVVENNRGKDRYYDTIHAKFRQVMAPALQKEPMIYMEESVNGSVYRMVVGNLTESADCTTFYFVLYNFTDPSQHKPGTFNTDDLAKLPREAFHGEPDCVAAFKKVFRGEYTGAWPDCNHVVSKQYPQYSDTVTCDSIYATISVESFETTSIAPVVLKYKGPRYPLIGGTPANYVSPCKDIP